MLRRFLHQQWLLSLVLLGVGAYMAADMVNAYLGYALVHSLPRTSLHRPPSGFLEERQGTVNVAAVLDRNLFKAPLDLPVSEQPLVQPVSAPARTPLPLQLIGTVVGGPRAYAVILDRTTREQALYHLEDLVAGEAKVVAIRRNEVVLLRGTQQEILRPPEAKSAATAASRRQGHTRPRSPVPPQKAAQDSGVRQVTANKWVLDRREMIRALENVPQLLTKARLVPNFTDGRPDGFRIFAIVPNSFYDKIGLQNGDVLQRINGIDIKDPQSFLSVFQQLRDESRVTMDLVRNNVRDSFEYEIQ